jgi:ferredoxin-fold anticodon binding domain-containing protein
MSWVLKNMIKSGVITYEVGDEVVLLKRKKTGYPKSIEDGEVYTIKDIENDHLIITKHSSDGIGWLQPIKVHKTYLINKSKLRDIKINSILNETNRV